MVPWELITGTALGAAGGAVHLVVTRWRASLAVRGGHRALLATYPLGLFAAAAAVALAMALSAPAGGMAVLGLWLLRSIAISRWSTHR